MHYSDDLIILEVAFIQGRPKETRLALLKDINTRVASAADISPDDMMITLYETPGENISFGRGRHSAPKPSRARKGSMLRSSPIVRGNRSTLLPPANSRSKIFGSLYPLAGGAARRPAG